MRRGVYPVHSHCRTPSCRRRALWDAVVDRSVTATQYGQFLIGVFEEWVRHDIGEVYVQMFDVALANWYGEPSGLCVFSKTCGTALALEHNGDLYSCDHFVEPQHKLGNIKETHMIELVASEQQRKFGQDKFDTLPQYCLECDVRFACHGGCPKDRFISTPDGEPGLNYLCAGYKLFFQHVNQPMQLMVQLLRQNRAPSELTQLYADQRSGVAGAACKNRPQRSLPLRKWPQIQALSRPRKHSTNAVIQTRQSNREAHCG